MNLDDFRKKAQSQREAPEPALDAVRKFLQTFFYDADLAEVGRILTNLVEVDDRAPVRGLAGLDALLADPPSDGTLARLVAFDANLSLDDPSDAGALLWLRSVAEMVREVLAKRR
jgi:hypothetical protein